MFRIVHHRTLNKSESSEARGWPGVFFIKTIGAKTTVFWIMNHKVQNIREILASWWGEHIFRKN